MLRFAATLIASTLSTSAVAETELRLPAVQGEPALLVRHKPGPGRAVLYVHGATFPSALSISYRIDGKSWADDLSGRGFDVWSLDLPGYGGSERPNPSATNGKALPVGRATDAARQIERVARFILRQSGRKRLALLAHSWGTLPTGIVAAGQPQWLDGLILFGPIARPGAAPGSPPSGSYRPVSAADQWRSFEAGRPVGEPPLILPDRFEAWAKAYLATDPTSGGRNPPSVQVPNGPLLDSAEVRAGRFPYDPARVRVPTLIVRGAWDSISDRGDAEWLAQALTHIPGGARSVELPRGGHRMHLENERQALFEAVGAFLAAPEARQ